MTSAYAFFSDDIFSSRSSLDSLFDAPSGNIEDVADVLVVGFADGIVHLSIYDLFEIGNFNLSSVGGHTSKAVGHCSHPLSTTHILLTTQEHEMQVIPFDMRLIHDAGRRLTFLASNSTQLTHILRYLRQVQRDLSSDFKSLETLPLKFIGLLEEELQEHHDFNWEQAAYHLALTGNCVPVMKEWLVDQVSDRVSHNFLL